MYINADSAQFFSNALSIVNNPYIGMSKMVPNVYYRLRWLGPISHMLTTQLAGSFWIKMFALTYKPLKLV